MLTAGSGLKITKMKYYTNQQTLKFKEERNAKSKFEKMLTKSIWQFNSRLQVWVNSVSRKKGNFNPSTKCMTILNS